MKKKALVVGSGFGGIASALRLSKLGFQVTISLGKNHSSFVGNLGRFGPTSCNNRLKGKGKKV